MHSQTTVKHEVFDVTISDEGQQDPSVGDDMRVRVKVQFKDEFRYESEIRFGPRCRILGYPRRPLPLGDANQQSRQPMDRRHFQRTDVGRGTRTCTRNHHRRSCGVRQTPGRQGRGTQKRMKLIETQRKQHFDCDGDDVLVRTLQPSKSCDGWPGTPVVIHEWSVADGVFYRQCTDDEIHMYEAALGEWPNIRIINHPTLGRVSTPTA